MASVCDGTATTTTTKPKQYLRSLALILFAASNLSARPINSDFFSLLFACNEMQALWIAWMEQMNMNVIIPMKVRQRDLHWLTDFSTIVEIAHGLYSKRLWAILICQKYLNQYFFFHIILISAMQRKLISMQKWPVRWRHRSMQRLQRLLRW